MSGRAPGRDDGEATGPRTDGGRDRRGSGAGRRRVIADGAEWSRLATDGGGRLWFVPGETSGHGVAPPSRPEPDRVAELIGDVEWSDPPESVSVLRVTIADPDPGSAEAVRERLVGSEPVIAAAGTTAPDGTTILDLLLDGSAGGEPTAGDLVELDPVLGVAGTDYAVGERADFEDASGPVIALDPDGSTVVVQADGDGGRAGGSGWGTDDGGTVEEAGPAWLLSILRRAGEARAEARGGEAPEEEELLADLVRLLARADRLAAFADADGPERLADAERTLEDATDRLAALEDSLEPVDEEDLRRLDELRSDLEELKSWQERLQTVFAASEAYPDEGLE